MESFLPVVQFLFPEFILENFTLTSFDHKDGIYQASIEEKNAAEDDPERKNLLSKGFFPVITVQDFPIRGHKVFPHIKRRRWLNTKTGKVVFRDWTEVAEGTGTPSREWRVNLRLF